LSIDSIIKNLQSQFGSGSVRVSGVSSNVDTSLSVCKTPSYRLNKALEVGGLPYGRIIEIFGTESGGKTTLLYGVIANAQKEGKITAFIDAEHSHMDSYAEKCGVDVSKLIVLQPDNGEEGVEMTRSCLTNGVNIVGIDSIAGLVPKVELEGNVTDAHMGAHPRLIGRLCRIITPLLGNDKMVICINQIREKLGVMFGSPETTTGGRALKFFASVRLDVRIIDRKPTYNDIKIRVVKNKVGSPYKEIETRIVFGSGVDKIFELVDELVESDILQTKNGGWYILKGKNLCQGKNNIVDMLYTNAELRNELEHAIEVLNAKD
jgi:recombination protein RecA